MNERLDKQEASMKVKKYTSILIGIMCITLLPIAVFEFIIYDIILGHFSKYLIQIVAIVIVLIKMFRLNSINSYKWLIIGILLIQSIPLQFFFINITALLYIRNKATTDNKRGYENKPNEVINKEYVEGAICEYKESYFED